MQLDGFGLLEYEEDVESARLSPGIIFLLCYTIFSVLKKKKYLSVLGKKGIDPYYSNIS